MTREEAYEYWRYKYEAEYISKQAFNDAIREAVRKCPNTFYNGLEVARQIAHDMDAADVVPGSDFRDCRNELCLRCGQYKTAHLGSCDGCRWRH